jgi:hypothetical protein
MVETRSSRRNSENIVDMFENKEGMKRAKIEASADLFEKEENPAVVQIVHNPYAFADEEENLEDK